jgi:hypothetical protein
MSGHQNAPAVVAANRLDTTIVSGPRARKPPARFADEVALNAGNTIDDPEDLTSDKDDREDSDYTASTLQQRPQDIPRRMVKPASQTSMQSQGTVLEWSAKYDGVITELSASRTVATGLRKKRAEDRKQLGIEKTERIRLEKVVKAGIAERAKLEDQLQQANEEFEEKFEQQQNDFNKAQTAMTKLVEKNETFTISDDWVRDRLQSIRAEWKSWAKEYSSATIQESATARIRELIKKTTLDKTASQQEIILQKLAAKPSSSAICLNALLALDVCKKTFGEPFLGLMALEDGHRFKEMNTRFLRITANG